MLRSHSAIAVVRALFGLTASVALAGTASADVIFVRANQILPTGLQNGTSWVTAFKDLQTALASATNGDQIWIAQGTYRPTSGTDRTISFALKEGVDLLGGFAGTEASPAERDILLHPTVLSGEIGAATIEDNSFHVLTSDGTIADQTGLDGLVITRGCANGIGVNLAGGGLRCAAARLVVTNCIFRDNRADGGGAGVLTAGSTANRRPEFYNCLFTGNTGSALSLQYAEGAFVCNSTIVGNTKGLICLNATSGTMSIANSVIYFNGTGVEFDQIQFSNTPSITVTGSAIQGWDNVNPSGSAIAGDPGLIDPDGDDDQYGTADDNPRLRGDSSSIDAGHAGFLVIDAVDADGDGSTSEGYPFDLAGNLRRIDDPLVADSGGGAGIRPDRGAFEYRRPRTVFVDRDAIGGNNGATWTSAYTHLEDAIAELNDPKFGGDGEIWVAEGTYTPTESTDTTVAFVPGNGVHLYGGFIGNGPGGQELERSKRDWQAHPTILSGELGGVGITDNSRHVVLYTGPFTTDTVLDGFHVRDGVATLAGGPGGGIAVLNDASPTIRHCVIVNNAATNQVGGAGVFLGGTTVGEALLSHCLIVDNGNGTTGAGAGVLVDAEAATILHCVIAANTSASSGVGAGVHFTTALSSARLANSVIFDNAGGVFQTLDQQVRHVGGGLVEVNCSAIEGFSGPIAGVNAVNCIAFESGYLVDPDGPDNVYGTTDDDARPSACSGLIDAANNALLSFDRNDLDGDGDIDELTPIDFGRQPRRVDLPLPNSGLGAGLAADIGPFEFQPTQLADADLNDDGIVDASDLAILLGAWLAVGGSADLNGDCTVNASDLAILLGAWS